MIEATAHDDADAWQGAVSLALRHADLATKVVQFFLIASTAVGGWVLGAEDLIFSPPFSPDRIVWAILYSMLSAPLWFALLDLQRRINACYAHARQHLPAVAQEMARDFDTRLVTYGFPAFVLTINLIILGLQDIVLK